VQGKPEVLGCRELNSPVRQAAPPHDSSWALRLGLLVTTVFRIDRRSRGGTPGSGLREAQPQWPVESLVPISGFFLV